MNRPTTILITGASSGLGAALAIAYAGADTKLILLGRNVERLAAIEKSCRARSAHVITASIDVTDRASMAEFIMRMDDESPIDLVIANAGISAGGFEGDQSTAQSDAVFAVNLNGVLNTIHPLLPRMVERTKGHVAIVASLAGICALPTAPAYSASKAAVRVYGDALRLELKPHRIDVSVICPGWIWTPLTEKNDFPMPLLMSAERAACIIKRHLTHRKARIAFPRRLYYPLLVLAALPQFLSDMVFLKMPKKRLKP